MARTLTRCTLILLVWTLTNAIAEKPIKLDATTGAKKTEKKAGEKKKEEKQKILGYARIVKIDKRRDRVSITEDPNHLWSRKDTVCIHRRKRALACGKIIAVGIRGAVIQLQPHAAAVIPGDEARYYPPDKKIPQITDEDISAEKYLDADPYTHSLTVGYTMALDLHYPMLGFYYLVSPSIAIGLHPTYLAKTGENAATTVKGFGGTLTVNYYGNEYFRGFWLQFATGFYHLTAKNGTIEETINAPVINLLAGWKEDWAHGLSVGAGLGGRWLSPLAGTYTDADYSSLNVIAMVEVGWAF